MSSHDVFLYCVIIFTTRCDGTSERMKTKLAFFCRCGPAPVRRDEHVVAPVLRVQDYLGEPVTEPTGRPPAWMGDYRRSFDMTARKPALRQDVHQFTYSAKGSKYRTCRRHVAEPGQQHRRYRRRRQFDGRHAAHFWRAAKGREYMKRSPSRHRRPYPDRTRHDHSP